jgi:hypothetical protein
MIPVPRDVLKALARFASQESLFSRTEQRRFNGHRESFDLERWIADHNLDINGPNPWQGGRKWIFPVCPWNADHRNRSAYIVQHANGAIAAGCHHNGCASEDWHTLRHLVEPGWRHTRNGGRPRGRTPRDRMESVPTHEAEASRESSNGETGEIHLTDWGNAQRLVRRFGDDLHYVHPWKKWLHWNGHQWEVDHLGAVEVVAKHVIGDLFRWAFRQVEDISKQLTGEETHD